MDNLEPFFDLKYLMIDLYYDLLLTFVCMPAMEWNVNSFPWTAVNEEWSNYTLQITFLLRVKISKYKGVPGTFSSWDN